MRLDLTGNAVQQVENYRDTLFKTLPKLEVLDRTDKNDEDVLSDDDDEDIYGEEGEFELDDDEDDKILAQLDDDTRKRLQEGKMTEEELEALGLGGLGGFPDDAEYGEEEVDEKDEEAEAK